MGVPPADAVARSAGARAAARDRDRRRTVSSATGRGAEAARARRGSGIGRDRAGDRRRASVRAGRRRGQLRSGSRARRGQPRAHGDLLRGVEGRFDLVVSNPPYVGAEEWERLQPEIRLYEPRAALVGTGVGEVIARDAQGLLVEGGVLVLEAGDGQAAHLAAALDDLGYDGVAITPDLAGRDRVVEGRRP